MVGYVRCGLRTDQELGLSPGINNEKRFILVLDIFGKVQLLREDKTEIAKSSCLESG